ncbi:GAF domain-containing protein [Trichothermofontia sp.]
MTEVFPDNCGCGYGCGAVLEAQRQFAEQIAESTLAILYVYDLIENRTIYVNAQVETILGYPPTEIQAMGSTLVPSLVHPDDQATLVENYQRCFQLADGEGIETEYRMKHKNGEYRWLLSRDRVFNRTATGAPRQILGVATDITRLKQAEISLYQQTCHEQLVATITNRIRQSLNLEDILATTVQEVRQVLQADRVLIFQLHQDGSGIVVAEAVVPDYPVTEKMRWLDECFPDACYEFYRQGQPRIVPDVATDEWASCLAEFMQEVGVKSKVVAPIVQTYGEGIIRPRVWGLLIAHACTHYRDWRPNEADLLHCIAGNLAIAIHQSNLYQQVQQELAERQRVEAALCRLNQELEQRVQERTQALQDQAERERLLRLIIQNIYRSLDIDDVLTTVLTETRQTLRADRVAIYQFNPDWSGTFIAESVGPEWVPLVGAAVQPIWADTYLQETQGARYQRNETFTVNDIYQAGHQPCHVALLEQFQARAYVIVPIFVQEHLWGLLAAYQNSGPRTWQAWEVNLLQQTGLQTAIALRQSQLYQAAQSQVKELERLNQLKDDFLSTVSHELRSPMASIKMATQMLELQLFRQGILDITGDTPFSRYFRILREECQREINLINDLLDLTRLDANNEPLCLSPLMLNPWIHHLVATFTERTRQQQQQLQVDIPDNLVLETDATVLERIVRELLHNACKYTPAGETIRISAHSLQNIGTPAAKLSTQRAIAKLRLCISNSGVEIPTEECDRIFDRFYRIPNHDPWKHGGTGLGLALVRKLVERLGGTICVNSRNQLTTFILEFP